MQAIVLAARAIRPPAITAKTGLYGATTVRVATQVPPMPSENNTTGARSSRGPRPAVRQARESKPFFSNRVPYNHAAYLALLGLNFLPLRGTTRAGEGLSFADLVEEDGQPKKTCYIYSPFGDSIPRSRLLVAVMLLMFETKKIGSREP